MPPERPHKRLTQADVPRGWDWLLCPRCFGVLPYPPDQTPEERHLQLQAHDQLCPDEEPPLPRAAAPVGECPSSQLRDGGHCNHWRDGDDQWCCWCGWPPRSDAVGA